MTAYANRPMILLKDRTVTHPRRTLGLPLGRTRRSSEAVKAKEEEEKKKKKEKKKKNSLELEKEKKKKKKRKPRWVCVGHENVQS